MNAEVAAALLEYVITHSQEAGEVLFRAVSGGPGYFDLPPSAAEAIAEKAQALVDAAEAFEFMPRGPARNKVRLFHSILKHPAYPDVFEAIRDILEGGLSVERAREYQSWSGPFRVIWTQTDGPYNKNVVWVAFDLDRKHFDHFLLADIDDTRRKSPVLVHLNMDVPGRKIVAVNGLPVALVRRALREAR